MNNRIVITGIGLVSPLGTSREQFWNNVNEGKTAFKPITLFDTASLPVNIAGEISDFKPAEIIGMRGLVDMDRATTLLLCAGKYALEDSKLEISAENTYRTGISVGTTFGSLKSLSDFHRESIVDGPRFVNPSRFPNTVMNSPAGRLAIRYGIKGFNSTISTGICASFDALDYGVNALQTERVDRVLVGAVEELCEQTYIGLESVGYLANNPVISCPFDKRRNGVIFSEGAYVVILELLESALNRGAPIYGELLSTASSYDAYHIFKYNPEGTGMSGAMSLALKKTAVKPDEIDCVFANANSTIDADAAEAKAITRVFNRSVPIASVKSMLGESLSASGIMTLAAALGSIANNIIMPNVNYAIIDELCGLDGISAAPRSLEINTVIINSFSPSGSNGSVILKKYTGDSNA